MTTAAKDHLTKQVAEAVRISREHVASGGIPFSGIVVRHDGRVLGTGFNRVREERDASAHAEVVALRNATKQHGAFAVHGATLIASGEPCALCYQVALYFGVEHIVYAADRRTAAQYGFDYSGSYAIYRTDPTSWGVRTTHLPVEGHEVPFQEYLANRGSNPA
ncbi:nucleoside deaminase [Streptomyces sp. NPDC093111]|uniref:nucleoside deaminase n=1 Tax=Streptomyces sp. NPDC093111 TaxID=3154978 RepID=UPI003426298F